MQQTRLLKVDESLSAHLCASNSCSSIPTRLTIENLPIELLSLIFELGCCGDENGKENVPRFWDGCRFRRIETATPWAPADGPRPFSFRIAVSLVCHHWYHVALSTPCLWTTLHLACWDSFDRLQAMLARSRGLPLDLRVEKYIEADAHERDDDDEVDPLPQIEQQFITMFRGLAPRLRSLRLWQARVSWSDVWILSLSNLTTLILEELEQEVRPSFNQFIALLRSAPALKRIVLHNAGPWLGPDGWYDDSSADDSTWTPDAPVSLLHLQDIGLLNETPDFLEGLLRQLYLPALKSLTLDLSYDLYFTFMHVLAGPATLPAPITAVEEEYSLLSRLEHLHIICLDFVDNTTCIPMLANRLHNVKLLQITCSPCHTPSTLLKQLLPHSSSGQENVSVTLPRLETLIVCRHVDAGIKGLIRKVIMKRERVGFPIKALYVQASDHEGEHWFRENVETFSFF